MKFVISTQEFNYLISKCLNVVGTKSTVPILSNLLIEAAHDELTVTATDLTVGIRCFADSKILSEGSTTLPAKRLSQLIRELTATNLEISTNSNEMTEIIADSSRFKLNGMEKDTFPSLPEFKDGYHFKTKQSILRDMFFYTSFAVSREDNRYTLTGVCLSIANGEATFAGTDGKRLAKAHMEVELDSTFQGTFIIPIKAVDEIQKNLLDEGEATVYLMKDKIAVEAGQTIIISKLLTGDYPDIRRIIPQSSEINVVLHREELMTLLRQISLFTSEASHSVRFIFTDGTLQLTANTIDIGEAKVSMIANYHGDKLEVAFNPGFFLDTLKHCKKETITLALIDAFNPVLITDDEVMPSPKASPLFVVMPMRLNED